MRAFMLFTNDLDITRGQSFRETHGELLELITDAGFMWTNETLHARRVPPELLDPGWRQKQAEGGGGRRHAITCAFETLGPRPSLNAPVCLVLPRYGNYSRFAHNVAQTAKQFALLSDRQLRIANGVKTGGNQSLVARARMSFDLKLRRHLEVLEVSRALARGSRQARRNLDWVSYSITTQGGACSSPDINSVAASHLCALTNQKTLGALGWL